MKKLSLTTFEAVARAHIAARLSKHTRSAYTTDFDRWLKFCENAKYDPTNPPENAGAIYRDALLQKHSSNTVHRKLASLSSIYNKAHAAKTPTVFWNPFNPDDLDWPSSNDYVKTPLIADEDAEAILLAAKNDESPAGVRDYAVLCLLYETGLRRDVASQLLRKNLRTENGAMKLYTVIKGGEEVEVAVPQRSARAIENYLAIAPESTYVFPGNEGKALSEQMVNLLMGQRAKEAGVTAEVTPHSFRAAYITAALDAGVPLHEVQASVHHKDPRTTQRYDRRARGAGVADKLAEFRKSKR